MFSSRRWLLVVCTVFCAAGMRAAQTTIAGNIYEDRLSLAVRPHFLAAEGVTVRLYRDDGDRLPSAGDVSVATTKSDRNGVYVFRVGEPGNYWISVDSHSFSPGAWPEQTFGPAGSLCAHPDRGTITTLYEGSCFGGKTATGSDDTSSLATAEHVALVSASEPVTNADFAFSYDAVVSIADSGQGTLRQFMTNANAVGRPNRMRFVPLQREATAPDGGPRRWWTIALASPLPALTDDDTTVDGMAWNYLSAASPARDDGRFGEPDSITGRERQTSRLRRPALEIVATGATAIDCRLRCGVRNLALHGTETGIVTHADSRIEHVLVGSTPDGATSNDGATGVRAESGVVAARHLLIAGQSVAGLLLQPSARIDAEHLDVSHCGSSGNGAGVVLLGEGSSIRDSAISENPFAGILLGGAETPARGNVLDGNTISGNETGVVLAGGSSGNAITRNDIMLNRKGGVVVGPHPPESLPRDNRISANRFDQNGERPLILGDHTSTTACDAALPPAPPELTRVQIVNEGGRRAILTGRACPGRIVELYQSYVASRERGSVAPAGLRPYSTGEFNYLGATNTRPDGTFEAVFPLATTAAPATASEEGAWLEEVMREADPSARAFAALAIDATGNTSELSERKNAD